MKNLTVKISHTNEKYIVIQQISLNFKNSKQFKFHQKETS